MIKTLRGQIANTGRRMPTMKSHNKNDWILRRYSRDQPDPCGHQSLPSYMSTAMSSATVKVEILSKDHLCQEPTCERRWTLDPGLGYVHMWIGSFATAEVTGCWLGRFIWRCLQAMELILNRLVLLGKRGQLDALRPMSACPT